ncbi:MAG: hypothetical protein HC837_17590, partial [Chloroflexaceae bacterium]|nr:hypothetical protein [Chloroflexaceae bacterium]
HHGPSIRVLTVNQHYRNHNIRATVAALLAPGADLILIQELSPAMAALLKDLSWLYPYQRLFPANNPYGMGLLSRYPVQDAHILTAIGSMEANLLCGETQLTVLNVHLRAPRFGHRPMHTMTPLAFLWRMHRYDTRLRDWQLAQILRQIDAIDGPLIVAGDWNLVEYERWYRLLAERLCDVYRATARGFGHTFPNTGRYGGAGALLRLDAIWVRAPLQPRKARVLYRTGGSDHGMVCADIGISSR